MAIKVNNLSTLLSKKFDEQRWIIEDLIPQDGFVILSAAPASCKTWLMLEMAKNVAQGEKFLGQFKTDQTGVLIIDEESGERLLQERIRLLQTDENLPIYYLSRASRKMDEEYAHDILETCHENGIKLVMFDSLIRFHSADENASSQMSQVLDCFKKLADKGISCLVLHHNKKKTKLDDSSGGDLMRGSSDILASCDIHMVVKKGDGKVTISQTKNRYRDEIRPIDTRFEAGNNKVEFCFLGYEKTKEEWKSILKEQVFNFAKDNPNLKKTELVSKFCEINDTAGKTRISNLVNEMLKEGLWFIEAKGPKNAKYITAINEKNMLRKNIPDDCGF